MAKALQKFLFPALLLCCLTATTTARSHASEADPQVENAIKKAYSGDIDGCEKELATLASQGEPDTLILWNLAAARVRQDRLGHALHSLMVLLEHDPPRKVKKRALELKESIISRLIERARQDGDPNLFALHDPRSLVEKWLGLFSPTVWRWAAYLIFWLSVLAWFTRSYGPRGARGFATVLAVLLLCLSAVTAASDLMTREGSDSTKLGVTVGTQTLLKEGLVDGAPTRNLPEGVVLEVLEEVTEKLVQVRLGDGREGFMAVRDLAIVE